MARHYHYFDTIISSQVALAELDECADGCTVPRVKVAAPSFDYLEKPQNWMHQWLDEAGNVVISLAETEHHYALEFPFLGCFQLAKDGEHITCSLAENVSENTFTHLLLDQVLPRYFAHFHNYLVLHGSCVSIGGKGTVFLGKSGWGKSTVAAAFLQRGHHLLTDDCLTLRKDGTSVIGVPSYCGVRLLPDSLSYIQPEKHGPQSPVSEYTAKQRFRPRVGLSEKVPMAAAFILNNPGDNRTDIKVVPLHGVKAITTLLRDNFSLNPSDTKWVKEQFTGVAEILAAGLPIFSLRYPRFFEDLPEVIKAVTASI